MFIIKNYSKFFIFILTIVFLLSISSVSADDSINGTVNPEIQITNEIIVEQYADGSPIVDMGTNPDDDLMELSECSSIVLHVNDNEGVISHRRDATNAVDMIVESGKWGDIEYVKQYKTPDGYFAHTIVTSNGWLVGNGGITDGGTFRQIESIASEMVVNNQISDSYLSRIHSILAGDSMGHFVIKAADGSYGVAFANLYHTGKLEPGQFVVCPNVYSYSQKNSFNTDANPVDEAIRIGYTDSYGVNRRNLMTYHWKLSETSNGLSYSVDVYASNDNGAGVGRSTSSLADNIYFFNNYISRSSLPATPGKVGLGTHVFSNSAIQIFNLLSPVRSYVAGESFDLKYQVNYIAKSNPVIRFSIPEGIDFNTVSLSKGTFTYDAAPRVVTWYLNDCDNQNFITLSLTATKSGQFNLVYSLNNKFVNEIKLNVNEYGTLVSASDVNKYYKGPERFNVYLKDITNRPIVGESIVISINGQSYTRQTNDNGIASIALNLNSGNYTASASYNGRFGKNSTTASVNVFHTISGNDIVKMYRNDTQYYAKFVDASGNPLSNTDVSFNINGVFYTRTTDANGQAKLNINLNPGDYILTAINQNNGEQHSNKIKVLPILVDGHDITKYYRNDSTYSIKVLDGIGNPLANADVKFNINGVFYTRTTNDSGYANLNLRLQPGSYVVTAEYNSLMYTNIVTILPVLFADDTVSHTDETNFKVRLIDGQGKPYANQSISFNINGVIYSNLTDSQGVANLIVNLADGEYIVTSSYDEYSINNKITVKNEA